MKNPKQIELVLKRKSGAALFDEIVIGDKKVLGKYRKQIKENEELESIGQTSVSRVPLYKYLKNKLEVHIKKGTLINY